MTVFTHIPSLCFVSYLPSRVQKLYYSAVPLFFLLSEADLSTLSVALFCLYSVLPSTLHMLCEYLHAVLALFSYGKYQIRQGAVSYVFNVRRIFHQISPMFMQIPTTIF